MTRIWLKWDQREFDATLRKYREYSKRDNATIVNTKSFYIARRAAVETFKTTPEVIRKYVRQDSGRVAGMIINKRLGLRGEKGLYGDEMADAVATMLAARLRSRAFLASGWIPAIKKLAPLAEHPGAGKAPRGTRERGTPKGSATPAVPGLNARCIIENTVQARFDRGAGEMHGMAGLKAAFDFETRSMQAYIGRKVEESARRATIRVMG